MAASNSAVTSASSPAQVAIVAYSGMDLTDFTGPMEVISHAWDARGQKLYKTTVASEKELSDTSQSIQIARDITIDEMVSQIDRYDVLFVPGGKGFSASHIPDEKGLKRVLAAFLALPPRVEKPRALVSICAGVFFLAEAGLLKGKYATAHYKSLNDLKAVGPKYGGEINVVRQHYVDVGVVNGLHVIVSGGITSGFDATLYFIEVQHGLEVAERARAIMDAWWRREALPYGYDKA